MVKRSEKSETERRVEELTYEQEALGLEDQFLKTLLSHDDDNVKITLTARTLVFLIRTLYEKNMLENGEVKEILRDAVWTLA